jgi:hypothetical protein
VFEFLVEEMAIIKTRKFHLVDGPASPEFRDVVESSGFPVPSSYKQFVLQFGNAKLYRCLSYWLVEVYGAPREVVIDEGERLLQFGRTHTSLAYFKDSPLVGGEESPVFEWRHQQGIRKTADGFREWLEAKCKWARKHYKKAEWDAIENGPPPFTPEEQAIVEARKQFRWQIVGIASNGDLRFEIRNDSDMILPYLSLGVHGRLRPPRNGPLNGGAYLAVSSILPHETGIVEHDLYKKFVAPEEIEAFDLPDPGPEDRERYWEFKVLTP